MHAPATAAAAIAAAAATAPRASGAAIAAATAPQPSVAVIEATAATATAAVMAAMAATAAAIAGTAMASRRPGSRPASAPPDTTAAAAGPMPITTPTTAPAATTDRDITPGVSGDGVGRRSAPIRDGRRARTRGSRQCRLRIGGGRQGEADDRSARMPRRDRELAAMPIDDRAADRETEPHPARLRGHERLEDLVGLGGIDAVARVPDLDDGRAALSARRDAQDAILGRRPGQGLDRVHQEVDDHLLDLIAVADRVHGLGGQLQTRRDVVRAQLPCDEADGAIR